MPFQGSPLPGEVQAPSEPHLAILTDSEGTASAFPPGAVFILVENPKEPGKQIPMALVRVTKHSIHLRCPCGNKGCTLSYTWQIKRSGHHSGPKQIAGR